MPPAMILNKYPLLYNAFLNHHQGGHRVQHRVSGLVPALNIQSFFATYLVPMQRHLLSSFNNWFNTIFSNRPIFSGPSFFQEANNSLLRSFRLFEKCLFRCFKEIYFLHQPFIHFRLKGISPFFSTDSRYSAYIIVLLVL